MLTFFLVLFFNPTSLANTEDEILQFLGNQYFQKLFEDKTEEIQYEIISPIEIDSSGRDIGRYRRYVDSPSEMFYSVPAFGDNFQLHLKKYKSPLATNFKYYARDGQKTQNLTSDFVNDCTYYGTELSHKNTTVAITTCQGLSGIIQTPKDVIIIQPLPYSLRSKRRTGKDHVVYKKIKLSLKCAADKYSDSLKLKRSTMYRTSSNTLNNKELTIEMAIFIDFDLFQHLSKIFIKNIYESILTLLLSIINAVQLILNNGSLTDKNIRFLIVRVDIMQTPNVNFQISNHGKTYITSFCKWQDTLNVADDNDVNHWDYALMLTGLDIFYKGNACAGLTPVGGMCFRKMSCSISEGKGFFSVFIIAHELGHSFGMGHDGDENNCNPKNYMMSPDSLSSLKPWSSCSRSSFQNFLNTPKSSCMLDTGDEKTNLNHEKVNVLLGQKYDADFQCQIEHGKPFLHDRAQRLEDICEELTCSDGFLSLTGLQAYEGSHCKEGFWCINKHCVKKPRNVVELPIGSWSDYTQFSQCNAPCLLKGTGIGIWERSCINKWNVNSLAHCEGSRFAFDICSDHLICKRRKSINFEALNICNNISQTLEIPFQRGGKQELNDETGGCQVWCLGMDNEYQAWKTSFPDGTPCGDKKFCVRGKCADFSCGNSVQDPNISSCSDITSKR